MEHSLFSQVVPMIEPPGPNAARIEGGRHSARTESRQIDSKRRADLMNLSHAVSRPASGTSIDFGTSFASAFSFEEFSWESFAFGKRIFDIVFALCALLILLPVLLLCAAAIWAESRGPILFRQRRLGQGGKSFSIVKVRTMIPDAEAVLQELLARDPQARAEWEKDRKIRNDPRVTRLGRFMRRTSLDELPQFWNVLVGDMSVVGPRPIVKSEIPLYQRAYSSYCAVRPGITGLWQVSGRNDTGYSERVELDCRYVASSSPLLDLSIVLKTVKTVIAGSGAY
jgi:exopolysaccharide production protein ExoY